jgi:hypothetical protein
MSPAPWYESAMKHGAEQNNDDTLPRRIRDQVRKASTLGAEAGSLVVGALWGSGQGSCLKSMNFLSSMNGNTGHGSGGLLS